MASSLNPLFKQAIQSISYLETSELMQQFQTDASGIPAAMPLLVLRPKNT